MRLESVFPLAMIDRFQVACNSGGQTFSNFCCYTPNFKEPSGSLRSLYTSRSIYFKILYCHVFGWLYMGFALVNRFIDQLHTRLWTTSTYSATADLHNSQITTAPAKPFQPAVSSPAIPWQRLLTVEILQLHALKSSLHGLPYRTDLALNFSLAYNVSTLSK
jgi:hypothetical protein